MVKKNIVLFSIFIIFLLLFSACGNEIEMRIKKDYLPIMQSEGQTDATLDDVKILNNYGNYNGAVVVRMNRGAYEIITKIQIDGVELVFNNSNTALVWHDGDFYELESAYNEGIISKDNLITLSKKINKDSN